jgi:hypothetical protein
LGTSTQVYNGDKKDVHKLLFCFELVGEADSKGSPFIVTADFNWSLNVKARLRAFLEGWRGKPYPDGEAVNVMEYLGMPCMLGLSEGQSNSGKKFVEVSSASPLVKGMQLGKPTRELFAWTFNQHDDARKDPPIPAWVPFLYGRKVVDDIKASHEWSKVMPF